jgi:hypothetical protein
MRASVMGYDVAQSARLAIMAWENSTGEEEKDVALGQVHGASAGIFDRRRKRSAGYRQH